VFCKRGRAAATHRCCAKRSMAFRFPGLICLLVPNNQWQYSDVQAVMSAWAYSNEFSNTYGLEDVGLATGTVNGIFWLVRLGGWKTLDFQHVNVRCAVPTCRKVPSLVVGHATYRAMNCQRTIRPRPDASQRSGQGDTATGARSWAIRQNPGGGAFQFLFNNSEVPYIWEGSSGL
jgi:hypothetical protein